MQPYTKNDDILFPKRDTKVYYDFGNNKDQEWLVEEILAINELIMTWNFNSNGWQEMSNRNY